MVLILLLVRNLDDCLFTSSVEMLKIYTSFEGSTAWNLKGNSSGVEHYMFFHSRFVL